MSLYKNNIWSKASNLKKQHINAGKCNQRAITPIQMTCFSCN
jgi:uncharacterized OB-fold protein